MPYTGFLVLSPSHSGSRRAPCSLAMKTQQPLCDVSAQGSHYRLSAEGFYWVMFIIHSLPSTYQKSRLLGEKQVININHTVCSLDTVSHPYQFRNSGNTPQMQIPNQEPSLQAKPQRYLILESPWLLILESLGLPH